MDNQDAKNLYQQLGELKGGMTSLITQVTTGFGNFTREIAETRQSIQNMGREQDAHREALRRDLTGQMTGLEKQIDDLKVSRATDNGAKAEANRRAKLSGAVWGTVAGLSIEIFKWLATIGHAATN